MQYLRSYLFTYSEGEDCTIFSFFSVDFNKSFSVYIFIYNRRIKKVLEKIYRGGGYIIYKLLLTTILVNVILCTKMTTKVVKMKRKLVEKKGKSAILCSKGFEMGNGRKEHSYAAIQLLKGT